MARETRHTTSWEDDRMAGVRCDNKDAGTICTGEDFLCECGIRLRLVWKVYLEEVSDAASPENTGSK